MTKDDARKRLVDIAASQVGVREQGGNNRGPMIREYQAATWLDVGPWPWCAAFVDWCVMQWVKVPEVPALLGVANTETWRPRTAGAWDLANWAQKKGLQILPESAAVLAGDLILFDFSHVGIVEIPALASDNLIHTIEGNTNGKGERDSVSGDGVWRKSRQRSLAKQFIRLL